MGRKAARTLSPQTQHSPISAQPSTTPLLHQKLRLNHDTMRFTFFVSLVVAVFTLSSFDVVSAKGAAKILPQFTEKWQSTLPKIKAVNAFKDAGNVRTEAKAAAAKAAAAAQKNADELIEKLKAGGQLKPLDTSNKEWRLAITNAQKTGQLKGTTEAQIVKVTEDAAQAIVKNPSKWRYVWKTLKISVDALLLALIVVGLNAMFY
ncbi:unnamed protein product [Phytophthora fragariaefolia]|uniref:Unnamed protein product n=1 Tax=Phytophthora fragariaefolia TaxID=1490495 RepID=A0A9W6XF76_9STRA|nr:unnamed protein product [Phytophthora fragariaefolia]